MYSYFIKWKKAYLTVCLSLYNAAVSLWLPAGCWLLDWVSSHTIPLFLSPSPSSSIRESERERERGENGKYRDDGNKRYSYCQVFFAVPEALKCVWVEYSYPRLNGQSLTHPLSASWNLNIWPADEFFSCSTSSFQGKQIPNEISH